MATPLDQLNAQILTNLGPDVTEATLQRIRDAFSAMAPADQQAMLSTLSGQEGQITQGNNWWLSHLNPFADKGRQVNEADLQKFLGTIVNAPSSVGAQATQSQAAATALAPATAPGVQLGETTDLPPGYGTPVMATGNQPFQQGAQATGGFNEQLQSYTANAFATAGEDVTALAQLAGVDPATLQAQYASYQRGMAEAGVGATRGALATDQQSDIHMSLGQFAQSIAQAQVGPWAALMDAINSVYVGQFGSTMPPDLAQQVLTALNGLPTDQKQAVLYQAMQYMAQRATAVANKQVFDQNGTFTAQLLGSLPSSILTFSPSSGGGAGTGSLGTAGIIGTYTQLHPSATLQAQTNQLAIASRFQSTLHRAPTAADFAALGPDPTDMQITTYINNQPLPNDPKITYGQYSTVQGFVDPLYQKYFGKPATTDQLMAYMGMNQSQITDHVMASPSTQLPGATVGRYVQLRDFADTAVQKIGYGVTDQVIAAAHSGMQK